MNVVLAYRSLHWWAFNSEGWPVCNPTKDKEGLTQWLEINGYTIIKEQ